MWTFLLRWLFGIGHNLCRFGDPDQPQTPTSCLFGDPEQPQGPTL